MKFNIEERKRKVNALNGFNLIFLSSIFIFLFFISPASALTQTNINPSQGIQVTYPKIDTLKNNQGYNFTVQAYNISSGVNLTTANCSIRISNPEGTLLIKDTLVYNSGGFNKFISSGNFTRNGIISFTIYCEALGQGGFADGVITISPTGLQGTSAFYFILILIIVCLFVLGYSMENNYIMAFASISILFLGFFVLTYGIDIIKDTNTTRAIGFILWGVGIIAIFKSMEEQLKVYG